MGLAVPANVGERLLHDPKDGAFERRSQPAEADVVLKNHLRHEAPLLVGQVFDGGNHPRFVENGQAQPAEQAARVAHGFAEPGEPQLEFAGRPLGIRASALGVPFQVHLGGSDLLDQAVVNFIGQQLAFALVNIEQLPEQPLVVLHGRFHAFAVGNVADGASQSHRPALVVPLRMGSAAKPAIFARFGPQAIFDVVRGAVGQMPRKAR